MNNKQDITTTGMPSLTALLIASAIEDSLGTGVAPIWSGRAHAVLDGAF